MRQRPLFVLLIPLLFSGVFSSPQDAASASALDSLNTPEERRGWDSLQTACLRSLAQCDPFRNELVKHFSLGDEITSSDIDNSIGESVGDLLRMRSWIDVVKAGWSGQPEHGLIGGNPRGLSVLIDGHTVGQQALYFPQKGEFDLNWLALSNISEVRFLPAGLANLWGNGGGFFAADITTKHFDGAEPYSRMTANKGPYGFSRTQAELGRGLPSGGSFYFTAELENSDGRPANSDYDGMALSGKTSFNLKRGVDFGLSAYRYRAELGLPLFADADFHDCRKKVGNWELTSWFLIRRNEDTPLRLNLRYQRQSQEVKSEWYDFERKKNEELVGLSATQNLRPNERHHLQIQAYANRKSLEALSTKKVVYGGYVSGADIIQPSPKLRFLLFTRIAKEEGLAAAVSGCGGVSYQVLTDINLFSTVGRFVNYPTPMDRFWLPFSSGFKDTVVDYREEGNTSLKSQKSLVADLGASLQKEDWEISAYLFGSATEDLIFWSNVDTSLHYGHFKPLNAEAEIWGANLNAEFYFLRHLSSYVSYSFKQGEDSDRRTRLPYSPQHSLFGYVQFEDEFLRREIGLKLRVETSILSERFTDEHERDLKPGVAILNGKITVRFLDFHFHYVVRNITDQSYGLTGEYTMPGRTFWWGFYWEFFD